MKEPKDYYYFKNYIVSKLDYKPTDKQYKEWHKYERLNELKN